MIHLHSTIFHTFRFEAAHFLDRLPDEHKCRRLHGHSYVAELELRGPLDDRGFVIDYDELALAWEPVHAALDHRLLNEVPGLAVPSTEIVAAWVVLRLLIPGPVVDAQGVPYHDTAQPRIVAIRHHVSTLLRAVKIFESHESAARMTREDVMHVQSCESLLNEIR